MGNLPSYNAGWPGVNNEIALLAVAFFRVMLAILCSETAWRYWRWWRLVYNEEDTKLLRDLMLGIAVAQAGFLFFSIWALVGTRLPRVGPGIPILFLGDMLVVCGTILHLAPAWRMSKGVNRHIKWGILARSMVALIIASALLILHLQ